MALPCRGLLVPLFRSSWGRWRSVPAQYWRNPQQPGCMCFGSARSSGDPECEPHTPVLLNEVLHYLDIQPGQSFDSVAPLCLAFQQLVEACQVFLDLTFGGGGHSKAILRSVPGVTVVAADRDPVAFRLAQKLAEEYPGQVRPVLARFSQLRELLPSLGLADSGLDAALLDAGCSSMQMDVAVRGFSLSKDGPLDMRMDGDRYPAMPGAADAVNALDQQALTSVLATYGEERHARKIAAAIAQARSFHPIVRTQQLARIVAGAFPACAEYARRDRLQRPSHVATKTFQALRVFVNDELNELVAGLQEAQRLLRPGGRLCVLTFHSLEDRIVKRFLRGEDLAAPRRGGVRQLIRAADEEQDGEEGEAESGRWAHLRRKVVLPSKEEVQGNPRGRSAKLRAAMRL